MTQIENKKRDVRLDIIRCTALFLIILCHTSIGLDEVSPILAKLKWFIGKCGVPMFIIISGYLNLPMKYGAKDFFRRRMERVFIPFLFWCFAYFILYAIIKDDWTLGVGTEDIFLRGTSAHLWYIYAILALYITTPILSGFFKNCSKRLFQFYLMIWLICTIFPYYYSLSGHRFFDHNVTYIGYYLSGYIGYYLLGYYLKRFQPHWLNCKLGFKQLSSMGTILIIALTFIYLGYYKLGMTTVELSTYTTVVPVLLSFITLSILWKCKPNNTILCKWIISVSKYSFGIYLIHEIIVQYFNPLIWENIDYSKVNDIVVLSINILAVILNIAISYVMVRLINLLPKSKYILG